MIVRLENSAGDAVVMAGGQIIDPDTAAHRTVDVGRGWFHPGLINAHDHLHRNHYPRIGSPPYGDAYAWGRDIHARCACEIARAKALDRRDALLFGALKNVLGGVTTVVHHDAWEPSFDEDFPIRVARLVALHSLGFERDLEMGLASIAGRDAAFCIHVAEGTNGRAAREVDGLDRLGMLDSRLIAVHAIGVDAEGIARLEKAGAAVVWCPTSNGFLFGTTAPRALLDGKVDVLLGTDALLTGEGTLLDELHAARRLGYLDDRRLGAAIGETAARRLGLPVPSLAPESAADVIVLRAPLLTASAADVALVIVAGHPVLADASIAAAIGRFGTPIMVGGVRKVVRADLALAAARVRAACPDLAIFEEVVL